jgi:hypothetical protein
MADQSRDISSESIGSMVSVTASTWSARSDADSAWKAGGRIDGPSGLGTKARRIAARSSTGCSCRRLIA